MYSTCTQAELVRQFGVSILLFLRSLLTSAYFSFQPPISNRPLPIGQSCWSELAGAGSAQNR